MGLIPFQQNVSDMTLEPSENNLAGTEKPEGSDEMAG
jgi:hypothetical protein